MTETREAAAWFNEVTQMDNPELQQFIARYMEERLKPDD
jgi:hypothetical protein